MVDAVQRGDSTRWPARIKVAVSVEEGDLAGSPRYEVTSKADSYVLLCLLLSRRLLVRRKTPRHRIIGALRG